MNRRILTATVLTLATGLGCRAMVNYESSAGPRYAAPLPAPSTMEPYASVNVGTLRVVTYNVKYAHRVDGAIYALRHYGPLRGADIILLQEMDAPATHQIVRVPSSPASGPPVRCTASFASPATIPMAVLP